MGFSESTNKPLNLDNSLRETEQSIQIQQLKSIGNQPRLGRLSPNVISATNAPAIALPQHVQNVQVRVTKLNDVSSRVSVTFKRNPNDYYFSQALVHVSGYQNNPAPVQVASGQSPISFTLENTGEPVAVHVQASGNLGPAPLETAPTATLQLRSTPLSTVATTAGNGPITISGTPGQLAEISSSSAIVGTNLSGDVTSSGPVTTLASIQGKAVAASAPALGDVLTWNGTDWVPAGLPNSGSDFWCCCDGSPYIYLPGSGSGDIGSTTAGQILFWMFRLDRYFTFYRVSFRVNGGGGSGSLSAFGIYDSTGATKYCSFDAIGTGTSGTDTTATLGAAVTLAPGLYIYAFGHVGGTGTPNTDAGVGNRGSSDNSSSWNKGGFTRSGLATAALPGTGYMPSSLGTLATTTVFPNPVAHVTFSPS
jgi:hypothetical protein